MDGDSSFGTCPIFATTEDVEAFARRYGRRAVEFLHDGGQLEKQSQSLVAHWMTEETWRRNAMATRRRTLFRCVCAGALSAAGAAVAWKSLK